MGFYNNPFMLGKGPLNGGTKMAEKYLKKCLRENRRKIEEVAEKIHPSCGSFTKKCLNLNESYENVQDSIQNGLIRSVLAFEAKDLEKADHLFVQRLGYTHHGLYIGHGKVIHYLKVKVTADSLETFADGAKIHKKSEDESPRCYSIEKVIKRAYSRLDEDNYSVLFNNCENFVRWCRTGT